MSAASPIVTPRLFATLSIVPENTDTLGASARLHGEQTQHPDASAHICRKTIAFFMFMFM